MTKGVTTILTTPMLTRKNYVWEGYECKGIFYLSINYADTIHNAFVISTVGDSISVSCMSDEVNGVDPQELVDSF